MVIWNEALQQSLLDQKVSKVTSCIQQCRDRAWSMEAVSTSLVQALVWALQNNHPHVLEVFEKPKDEHTPSLAHQMLFDHRVAAWFNMTFLNEIRQPLLYQSHELHEKTMWAFRHFNKWFASKGHHPTCEALMVNLGSFLESSQVRDWNQSVVAAPPPIRFGLELASMLNFASIMYQTQENKDWANSLRPLEWVEILLAVSYRLTDQKGQNISTTVGALTSEIGESVLRVQWDRRSNCPSWQQKAVQILFDRPEWQLQAIRPHFPETISAMEKMYLEDRVQTPNGTPRLSAQRKI